MANIDSLEEIEKLDQDGYLKRIQEFPDQAERAWSDWKKIPLPASYIQAKNVLIAAMGGSAQGASIVDGLATTARIPVTIWRDYGVPAWLNKDTLMIACSYSGNTEETVDCFEKAAAKTDRLITISSGGQIESLSRKYKSVHYSINYDSPPRQSLGFQLTAILAIFDKLDLIEVDDSTFEEAILLVRGLQKKIDVNVRTANNPSKLLALKIINKIPIVYGAGIMSQVARRAKGHFNENSKSLSYFEILPEVHHNAMVGLEQPKELTSKIITIILQSKFNHPRNILRENITQQILQKKRISSESIMIQPAPTALAEILQMIHLLDYASYYLGILYNENPTSIAMVDLLKEKLAEHPMEE